MQQLSLSVTQVSGLLCGQLSADSEAAVAEWTLKESYVWEEVVILQREER